MRYVMMFVICAFMTLNLSVVHPLSLGVCVVVCMLEGVEYGQLRKWLLIINPFPRSTVNHWQAISFLGLNVQDDKDAGFARAVPGDLL